MGNMAVKLDLNKAYDRIEWDFLYEVFLKMGFSSRWLGLIGQCVSTISFNIVVNRSRRCSFVPSRGLRQGDPLSPYLFLCVQDMFSAMIFRAVSNNSLKGINIKRRILTLLNLFLSTTPSFSCNLRLKIV